METEQVKLGNNAAPNLPDPRLACQEEQNSLKLKLIETKPEHAGAVSKPAANVPALKATDLSVKLNAQGNVSISSCTYTG